MIFSRHIKYFDWLFFGASILLSLIGLVMIYSTGLAGRAGSGLWLKQLLYLGLGLGGLFFFSTLDYRFLGKSSSFFYLLSIALLIGVLFFGQEIRHARRWFDLGFFNFQVAEFSKFALVILLAKYFQIKNPLLQKFRYVVLSAFYALIPAGLIMLQPDLGSAFVLVFIWFGLLIVGPVPKKYFFYLLIIFLVIASLSWQFALKDYQRQRVETFLNPSSDPQGRGYNVIQSMVAIGSGGLAGRGLARGLQSQLKFLPERQTDFIFASSVEELGLVGGVLILFFFSFMLFRLARIQKNARDFFGTYLASGVFFFLFSQATINIGMNLGLLPVTGVTLPFLSYGGSSLVITFCLVGIAESVARHSVPVRFR